MARLYLNTYTPLVYTPAGAAASERYDIPPFVDGSIRREPDLEHPRPSISCLCRAGKFAPRLAPGDTVVYMTKKLRRAIPGPRRVTAVLKVERTFESHEEAAGWYRGMGLALPSNCMVRGNPPRPLSQSVGARARHRACGGAATGVCNAWDAEYGARARRYGRFVVCERLWACLDWDAPVATDADLRAVFDRLPGTRNPGAHDIALLTPLVRRLRIDVPPSSR